MYLQTDLINKALGKMEKPRVIQTNSQEFSTSDGEEVKKTLVDRRLAVLLTQLKHFCPESHGETYWTGDLLRIYTSIASTTLSSQVDEFQRNISALDHLQNETPIDFEAYEQISGLKKLAISIQKILLCANPTQERRASKTNFFSKRMNEGLNLDKNALREFAERLKQNPFISGTDRSSTNLIDRKYYPGHNPSKRQSWDLRSFTKHSRNRRVASLHAVNCDSSCYKL